MRLDLERFAGGFDGGAPMVELDGAKGHTVPGAKMAGLHFDDEFAEFDAAGRPAAEIKDGSVFVDGLGPTGVLAAEADELFFGVGEVTAFHQVDGQVDGGTGVGAFFIEPAFPNTGGGERGGHGIGEGQAIGQFVFGADDNELEEGDFLLAAIAGFEGANKVGDAGRGFLLRRRNKLFVQANHVRTRCFPILA